MSGKHPQQQMILRHVRNTGALSRYSRPYKLNHLLTQKIYGAPFEDKHFAWTYSAQDIHDALLANYGKEFKACVFSSESNSKSLADLSALPVLDSGALASQIESSEHPLLIFASFDPARDSISDIENIVKKTRPVDKIVVDISPGGMGIDPALNTIVHQHSNVSLIHRFPDFTRLNSNEEPSAVLIAHPKVIDLVKKDLRWWLADSDVIPILEDSLGELPVISIDNKSWVMELEQQAHVWRNNSKAELNWNETPNAFSRTTEHFFPAALKHSNSNFNQEGAADALISKAKGLFSLGSLPDKNIRLTRGVSDALDLVMKGLGKRDDTVLISESSYPGYKRSARGAGLQVKHFESHQSLDGAAFSEAEFASLLHEIAQVKPKIILLANPTNIEGNTLNKEKLELLLKEIKEKSPDSILVIDAVNDRQANHCYSDYPNYAEYIHNNNLVVVNGASKSLGLSGARIGIIAASTALLDNITARHSISKFGLTGIEAALLASDAISPNINAIYCEQQSKILERRISALGTDNVKTRVITRPGNFILFEVEGRSNQTVYQEMKEYYGIHLTPAANSNLLRMSINMEERNEMFALALQHYIGNLSAGKPLSEQTKEEFKEIRKNAHRSFHVRKSIELDNSALEASYDTIIQAFRALKYDDLPKEAYRNYIRSLARAACSTNNPPVAQAALDELCFRMEDTSRLETIIPSRHKNRDDYFHENVADNQVHLNELSVPFQAYYDENGHTQKATRDNVSELDKQGFRELAFFKDGPLAFRPMVTAEALAAVVLEKQDTSTLTVTALKSLTEALNSTASKNEFEANSIKWAAAKGLSEIVIHHNQQHEIASNEAFHILLSGLFSGDQRTEIASLQSILRIAAERPEAFLHPEIMDVFLRGMVTHKDRLGNAIVALEALALNAKDALKAHTHFLNAVHKLRQPSDAASWKYFDYYLKEKNDHFSLHTSTSEVLKGKDAKCLIVHNIREALGDEWIRESSMIQSLLQANPDVEVTILTDRPFLYNHPRIKALSIKEASSLDSLSDENTRYGLVINQYYNSGAYSEEVQNCIQKNYRQKAPVYLETACESNYYNTGYAQISVAKGNKREVTYFMQEPIENAYATTYRTIANLGLPLPDHENILCATPYPPAETWWKHHVLDNSDAVNRQSMIYNPFGGTYEDKGHTRYELDVCAAEIIDAVNKGYYVIIPPGTSEWSSRKVIETILERLPEDIRRHCTFDVPTPNEDSRLQLHLMSKSDKIVSIAGGITHLAMSLRKPVDITVAFSSADDMWLPNRRVEKEQEIPLLDSASLHMSQYNNEYLKRNAGSPLVAHPETFSASREKLCLTFESAADSMKGNKKIDGDIPDYINGLETSLRRDIFRPKLLEGERGNHLLSFLKESLHDLSLTRQDISLVDVTDFSTGRALVPGHVVYKIDLDIKGHGAKTIFLKGYGKTEQQNLQQFSGWEGRPQIHLYEEFFHAAAELTGVSQTKARFYTDYEDKDLVGFTLIEQAKGKHSDQFFEYKNEKIQFKPDGKLNAEELLTKLAQWHAFSELLGMGDRRFVNIDASIQRPSNYLLSQSDLGKLQIEGIDHELLFGPPSLKEFERKEIISELAVLKAFPASQQNDMFKHYEAAYEAAWNGLLKDDKFSGIRQMTADYFGENSVEMASLDAAKNRNPQKEMRLLWASMNSLSTGDDEPKPMSHTERLYDNSRKYKDQTVLIKFSGKVVGDEPALRSLVRQAIRLKQSGANVVLVHGGGDQIDAALDERGIAYSKQDGVRFTSAEAVVTVSECLNGLNDYIIDIFKEECKKAGADVTPVGVSGTDHEMIMAKTKFPDSHTGEVVSVNTELLKPLCAGNNIPVINPICAGEEAGKPIFNVNADEVAASVAKAINTDLLIFCSNTYIMDKEKKRLPIIKTGEVEKFIGDGTFTGGVVIKTRECRDVLRTGHVKKIIVLNGRDSDSLENELFGDQSHGSHIE